MDAPSNRGFTHLSACPPWPDSFPESLAASGEKQLSSNFDLDFHTYTTTRFMLRQPDAPTELVASVHFEGTTIFVENLPDHLAREFVEHDVHLVEPGIIISSGILQCVDTALRGYLSCVPGIGASVKHLVRVIHILSAASDEYDISYSNPDIPFSIFVSVPVKDTLRAHLRVVEAIIHETTHLQLTLLEQHIPLLISSAAPPSYYSPWKKTHRQAGGILHALYVFRVVSEFWSRIACVYPDPITQHFATSRCEEIAQEIKEVLDFAASPALTPQGRELVERLLAG